MSAFHPNTFSKSRPRPIAPEGLPWHITVASPPSGWGIRYPNVPSSPLQGTSRCPWFGNYSAESVEDSFTVQCQDGGHDRQKAKEACPRRLAFPTRAGISPAGISPSTGNTSPKVGSSRRWNLSAGCSAPQVEPLTGCSASQVEEYSYTCKRKGLITVVVRLQMAGNLVHLEVIPCVAALSRASSPFQVEKISCHRKTQTIYLQKDTPPGGVKLFHLQAKAGIPASEGRHTCGRRPAYLRGESRNTCGGKSTSVEGRLEGHLQGMRQPGK